MFSSQKEDTYNMLSLVDNFVLFKVIHSIILCMSMEFQLNAKFCKQTSIMF